MLRRALDRLCRPRHALVVGGGAWGCQVVEECQKIGFAGEIYVVHPAADEVAGIKPFKTIADLPVAPDACFIAVNRQSTVEVVGALAQKGAGGAICFAAGFKEAAFEDQTGQELQAALVEAAGNMPIIGPNCYGFVNYLDQFCLWPDQHGGQPVERGVALICQSSNILINLTMQRRGLPIAYAFTVGNQAQTSLSQLALFGLEDPRVTALGLYVEGVGDLREFEDMAYHAHRLGKRIVVLKTGRSEQAQQAALSHTASIAGSDAGASALLERLGISRAQSLSAFVETLKILHFSGSVSGGRIASLSCSGGEASLMADSVLSHHPTLSFPPLSEDQKLRLREALGSMVALANPLDYNTFIWGDEDKMADCFSAMLSGDADIGVVVVDFPRSDHCSQAAWECVIRAAIKANSRNDIPLALMSSLVENMPEQIALSLAQNGIIPLCGMDEGLSAIAHAICLAPSAVQKENLWPADLPNHVQMMSEADAKAALARAGIDIPKNIVLSDRIVPDDFSLHFPVALKTLGLAHKSEAGGLCLNLQSVTELKAALIDIKGSSFLIEEMVQNPVAELLVGVVADPAHGYVLTLAAGGVLSEIMKDRVSMLLPVCAQDIQAALSKLKIAPVLRGYRGAKPVNEKAVIAAILALQEYVKTHKNTFSEMEINPLILTPNSAIAADALIFKRTEDD